MQEFYGHFCIVWDFELTIFVAFDAVGAGRHDCYALQRTFFELIDAIRSFEIARKEEDRIICRLRYCSDL